MFANLVILLVIFVEIMQPIAQNAQKTIQKYGALSENVYKSVKIWAITILAISRNV